MNLGEHIKFCRESKGYKQKDLAAKLNIATNTLSRYETGEREPSLEMLQAIADILEIGMDDLVMGNKHVESFNARLVRYRKIRGLSQEQLAERIGSDIATIVKLESGEIKPYLESELPEKIAAALDMTQDELFYNIPLPSQSLENAIQYYSQSISDEKNLLNQHFDKLNSEGKAEAVKRVEQLTRLDEYTVPDDVE